MAVAGSSSVTTNPRFFANVAAEITRAGNSDLNWSSGRLSKYRIPFLGPFVLRAQLTAMSINSTEAPMKKLLIASAALALMCTPALAAQHHHTIGATQEAPPPA